jgi:transposase
MGHKRASSTGTRARAAPGERFEDRIENNTLKCIESGKTVIMDNAWFNRRKQLQGIYEKAGADLLFPPLHSPDFNPVEKEWANMKRGLRDTASLHALY